MRDLNYDFKQLCRRNRDGSFATQADREHILDLIADQLYEMGVRHIARPELQAQARRRSSSSAGSPSSSRPGTHQEPDDALRWSAEKIGKENIVARTNAAYGIPDRVYVTNMSKPRSSTSNQLDEIRCPYTEMSLRLQAGFGLRREESIKIVPGQADQRRRARAQGLLVQGRPRDARFPSAPPNSGSSSTRRRRSPRVRAWWRPAMRSIPSI